MDRAAGSADGSFVEVDGVRLHYGDCGDGNPVVLLHGRLVAAEDVDCSGIAETPQKTDRVIVFDRPGSGIASVRTAASGR